MKRMNRDSGSILFMVVVIGLILTIVGGASLYIAERERIFSLREWRSDKSFYLAETGIERVRNWLLNQQQSPESVYGTTTFDPFMGWNSLASFPGRYRVSVDPDDSNPAKRVRRYLVSSTGTVTEGITITKNVMAVLEVDNILGYAYYSYMEYPGGASGLPMASRRYFSEFDSFDGPVRSDDEISIIGKPSFSLDEAGLYEVSTSSDIYYWEDGLRSEGANGGGYDLYLPEADYPLADRVDKSGSGLLVIGDYGDGYVDRCFSYLRNASPKLLVGAGAEIKIKDKSIDYRIPPSGAWNNWPVPASGGVVEVNGDVGMIYSNTASTGFEGKMTVFTTGTIVITDNITYSHSSSTGMIGMVAGVNIIVSTSTMPPGADLTIESAMMTFGSFRVKNVNSIDDPRTLNIFGTLIQHHRGVTGVFSKDASENVIHDKGFCLSVDNDFRMVDNPPPRFPKGKFGGIIQWLENPRQIN